MQNVFCWRKYLFCSCHGSLLDKYGFFSQEAPSGEGGLTGHGLGSRVYDADRVIQPGKKFREAPIQSFTAAARPNGMDGENHLMQGTARRLKDAVKV